MFVNQLKKDFPSINFIEGNGFYWSPKHQQIHYLKDAEAGKSRWTLLHEISHAKLNHISYKTDIELLNLEVTAWHQAAELAKKYKIKISEEHIQNCLDSYRDWLHLRSTCPRCDSHSLQTTSTVYKCFNCKTYWKVSAARFCRPYRMVQQSKETSPEELSQVMFL